MNNNSTLVFYRSDNVSFGGVISGTGSLVQSGAGASALTLSGANTYTGMTIVGSGVLVVDGSIASSSLTRVYSGATLGGVGTVGNVTVASGGVFAPGSGVAGSAMTVSGNLTIASGATYQTTLNATTASLAQVSGTATLTGASLNIVMSGGPTTGTRYTILTDAAGGLGGTDTFDVSTLTYNGLIGRLSNLTDVFLTFAPPDITLSPWRPKPGTRQTSRAGSSGSSTPAGPCRPAWTRPASPARASTRRSTSCPASRTALSHWAASRRAAASWARC